LKKFYKSNKGVSLIEVLVAMFIVSTVVLAVSSLSFTESRIASRSKQRLEALIAAETYLEQIRADRDNKRFNDVTSLKIYLVSSGFEDKGTILSKKEYIGNFERSVSIYIDGYNDRLIQIVVEVDTPTPKAVKVGTKLYMDRAVY
jgi:prepilin-type N-terminal cleavage/methylation domain-containing protein